MKLKLATLSLIIILVLIFMRGVNIYHMVETNNTGDSFADIAAYVYVFAGAGLLFISWKTVGFKIFGNPLAIIPYGIGLSCLVFGLFLLYVKGFI
jgi:hypothetical protein